MGQFIVINADGKCSEFDDLIEAWTMATLVENSYLLDRISRRWGVSFYCEVAKDIDLYFYSHDAYIPPEIRTKALLLL